MTKGNLIIVTAPSGAGKTSLVKSLVEGGDDLCVSVSHTTRPARPGERDGINYHFVSKDHFMDMLDQGAFFESAEVYDSHYGTSQIWVKEQLQDGKDVILEIDWQGAQQVRKLNPETCSIFILPPSLESLRERLEGRGQDDKDTIDRRMRQAVSDITHVAGADYIVVNDDFDTALADMRAIIRSWRLTVISQQFNKAELLASLGHD
jgi:guanylate kinase|tara:strand:- start:6159 stop:6776 length:618 start_codon:yes stop_codon:yes gene_type:complete